MGNESSQLTGLEIEEKAVEVTDFWTHNSAILDNDNLTQLSVFIGETFIEGALWNKYTPLEKLAKNLMLHRHPCILKYVSSWNKGSKHYLAIEYVKPLSHAISSQTPLQICIGLYSILKAIAFLHEKANSSHNNICSASIYVTKDGSWKLGGLEYLSRYDDLTVEYLTKTRSYRYEKSIDPNENDKSSDKRYLRSGAIDKYGFSILALELLNTTGNNSDIPCLEDFKIFCKTELQKKDYTKIPSFKEILEHQFFTHEFIKIYSFLTELALKTESEKQEFFSTLTLKLQKFPEDLVAKQLGELLISRLVLLDETACQNLLPFVFTQKSATIPDEDVETQIVEDSENGNSQNGLKPLFTGKTFQQYIVPRLLHIFCVRDAQIRLLLLKHFKNFVHNFSKEQLQNIILPELLLGIKDTNDHLVAVTLIALSDLVPILGGATVIGGKRLKLFNDGRPAAFIPRNTMARVEILPNTNIEPVVIERNSNLILNELPERLSPDGGEDEIHLPENTANNIPEEDLDSWSDWDHEENNQSSQNQDVLENNFDNLENSGTQLETPSLQVSNILRLSDKILPRKPEITTDILSLDIKSQKNLKSESDELDFFQDMEPVIEKTSKIFIDDSNNDLENNFLNNSEKISEMKVDNKTTNNLLAMTNDDADDGLINEDCWGDDLSWVKN